MYVGCHRFTDRREGLHRRHDVIVDDVTERVYPVDGRDERGVGDV